jgi:hypothetical protein
MFWSATPYKLSAAQLKAAEASYVLSNAQQSSVLHATPHNV